MPNLLQLCDKLGLPVAGEKLELRLTFLGFELDTLAMEVCLPEEKLRETQRMESSWLGRKSCQCKDLESLVGKLAHASKVIQPRKTFMKRMFELLKGTIMAHHHVRLNAAFKADLIWLVRFLEEWNGMSVMLGSEGTEEARIELATDASGNFACGAVWLPIWLQWQWRESGWIGLRSGALHGKSCYRWC